MAHGKQDKQQFHLPIQLVMINLSDQLHAATESGVLVDAKEIKDTTQNMTQEQINKKALAWAAAGMVL